MVVRVVIIAIFIVLVASLNRLVLINEQLQKIHHALEFQKR
jgi:hypothetical protein